MEKDREDISRYEKQNAMISYCFLWIFILFSKQERFASIFVKSHARIATLIQFLFLLLVVAMIKTGHLWSMLIFDFSLSNIFFFIGFAILLAALFAGGVSCLLGKMPSLQLSSFSPKELTRHIMPTNITSADKIPAILCHIPLIGNYIASKYGTHFESGERFGTWSIVVSCILLLIDPSMTFAIILWCLIGVWIVYQSISLAIDDCMIFVGKYLPTSTEIHIFVITLWHYTQALFLHTRGTPPNWHDISTTVKNTYHPNPSNTTLPIYLSLPLINIYPLFLYRNKDEMRIEIIQWWIITLLFIVGSVLLRYDILFVVLYMSYIWFLSIRFCKYLSIPILAEISYLVSKCILWFKKISKKDTINLPM